MLFRVEVYVPKLNNVLNNALVTTQMGHILRNVSCLVTLAQVRQRAAMLLCHPCFVSVKSIGQTEGCYVFLTTLCLFWGRFIGDIYSRNMFCV